MVRAVITVQYKHFSNFPYHLQFGRYGLVYNLHFDIMKDKGVLHNITL